MTASSADAIAEGLREAVAAADVRERLAAYGARLLETNRLVNLTGANDAAALVPHLTDALTLLPWVDEALATAGDAALRLVDVGSGGGFPGIPLALAAPRLAVVLIEPIRKKAAFLTAIAAEFGLDAVVLAERAETVARDPRYRETADLATARAVSRAPTVAELTVPLVRVGGRVLLQRGRIEETERRALEDAAPILGADVVEERSVGGERRVVVLAKRRPTGERFPRRNGVPEKRPLCLD